MEEDRMLKGTKRRIEKRKHQTNIRRIEHLIFGFALGVSILAGAGIGLFASVMTLESKESVLAKLENYRPVVPTKVYDIKHRVIGEFFRQKREIVEHDEIPHHLIDAIIAMEDNKFFEHPGIDVVGILRAIFVDIIALEFKQGASTLTQQLARNIFEDKSKSIIRKVREMWWAFQIEKKYTKKEILTLYFNLIYFGHSAYGVQAASQFYFEKNVSDITIGEAALLATLPPAPNLYSPFKNEKISRKRHRIVLNRMVKMDYITREEADDAYRDFWEEFEFKLKNRGTTVFSVMKNEAPYFMEYVRQFLVNKYGEDLIYKEGIDVYTSLDLEKQKIAQQTLAKGLKEQNKYYASYTKEAIEEFEDKMIDTIDMVSLLYNLPINVGARKMENRFDEKLDNDILLPLYTVSLLFDIHGAHELAHETMEVKSKEKARKVEGALISIDPNTGHIIAMVGGSGFTRQNQFNRTVQAYRQAGSAFKPFLYGYAIASKRFTAASGVLDEPISYMTSTGVWAPENYGGGYKGLVRLRKALRLSINVVSIKLIDALGPYNVVEFAEPIFNVQEDTGASMRMFPRNLTMSLGTGLFSPLELSTGFAVIANGGKEVHPIAILRVKKKNGAVLDDFQQDLRSKILRRGGAKQVIPEAANGIIRDMMQDVVRRGTATGAMSRNKFYRPAAGKTGTSSEFRDAWFCGFTPQLVTAVWVGFDRMEFTLGHGRAGGVVAAPIWAQYMRDALENEPVLDFPKPKGVVYATVCGSSGKLLSGSCSSHVTEMFLPGTIPGEVCTTCAYGIPGYYTNGTNMPAGELTAEEAESEVQSFGEF